MGRAEGHNLGQRILIRLLVSYEFGLFRKVVEAKALRSQGDTAAAAVAVIGIDINLDGQGIPHNGRRIVTDLEMVD